MTNQQRLGVITAEEFVRKIHWLYHEYGKRFNDSPMAIIEWLKQEEVIHEMDRHSNNQPSLR